MVKVTIILPVYNGEKYIRETIEQLCRCKMTEIEILIIDDGSEDKSYDIMIECAKKDSRIKLYKKKNEGGVYAARNYGLERASGEYVCFCDQDDIMNINMCSKMYDKTLNGTIDIVMCSTAKLLDGKTEEYEMFPDVTICEKKKIEQLILANLFRNTKIISCNDICLENTIWKCMIKNEFIKKNGLKFQQIVNYEDDWIFLLESLSRANCITMMSDILYFWKINLKSESYNSRYVKDMYVKDQILQNKVEAILKYIHASDEIINLYHYHYNCTRYINLIENELKNDQDTIIKKLKKIKVIKKEEKYKDSLEARKLYNLSLIRKIISLSLLSHNQFFITYYFLMFFRKIKLKGIKNGFWIRLERKARYYC